MDNSYLTCLVAALKGVILDAKSTYPDLAPELEHDLSQLLVKIEHRGIRVLTLELPALGKHLDRCLADAVYLPSMLPLSKATPGGRYGVWPQMFRGLYALVFEPDGLLKTEPDITAIALLRQLLLLGKKVAIDCEESARFQTVSEFYQVDDALPLPTLLWDGQGFDASEARRYSLRDYLAYAPDVPMFPTGNSNAHSGLRYDFEELGPWAVSLLLTCQLVADMMAWELGRFDPSKYSPKHGPGAVSDRRTGEFKYDFPCWPERLSTVFPYDTFAFANMSIWADTVKEGAVASSQEPASRLICVPKTQKSPRLIASEPTAHQWCQQVIWDFFRDAYSRRSSCLGEFVHFHDQTHNQQLACQASRNDSHWTVDLSAASDRISCKLVERMFRASPGLLQAFHASRTRFIVQDIDKKSPRVHRLKKFSTMGSACTFPVQSHIFMCLGLACLHFVRNDGKPPRNMEDLAQYKGELCVFGDDIIIPSDAGRALELVLGYLSLKVNHSKTYRSGKFRESCGMDAFDGVDVTPAYVIRPAEAAKPETIASVVESANNFHSRGWWNAAAALRSTVPNGLLIPVGSIGSGVWGDRSFCGDYEDHLQRRWNQYLHRWEIRVHRVSGDVPRYDQSHWGQLLQYFAEDPTSDILWKSGATGKAELKLRKAWVPSVITGKKPA